MTRQPILSMTDIRPSYRKAARIFGGTALLHAVDGISLSLAQGETLGIVGESGSGKSTLGRFAAGIDSPSSGQVLLRGQPYPAIGSRAWRAGRREVQFIFQDPASAMDPRKQFGIRSRKRWPSIKSVDVTTSLAESRSCRTRGSWRPGSAPPLGCSRR